MNPETSVKILNMTLESPTILSSGILGVSADTLKKAVEFGAGAVVTKSASIRPRKGNPNPTIVEVSCGLLNAMGLPNPGMRETVKEIQQLKKANIPVIASVFGYDAAEYVKASHMAEQAGADAIELNVSCPHVKEVGSEIGKEPERVCEITRAVKRTVSKPVTVKLTPNTSDIGSTAEAAEKGGADALTVANTVKAIAIDIDLMRPVLAATYGGMSGPAVKPIALRCVYEVYERAGLPIIGSGGVHDWKDTVEFILAGASAVQIGTAVMYRDWAVFNEINRGILAYLKEKNLGSLAEIVGLAHRERRRPS